MRTPPPRPCTTPSGRSTCATHLVPAEATVFLRAAAHLPASPPHPAYSRSCVPSGTCACFGSPDTPGCARLSRALTTSQALFLLVGPGGSTTIWWSQAWTPRCPSTPGVRHCVYGASTSPQPTHHDQAARNERDSPSTQGRGSGRRRVGGEPCARGGFCCGGQPFRFRLHRMPRVSMRCGCSLARRERWLGTHIPSLISAPSVPVLSRISMTGRSVTTVAGQTAAPARRVRAGPGEWS